MKFNFKKITAIGASILMTGFSAGIAAAASFPAPFVDNGTANVAIVYGTGSGVSSLDMVQAGNIQTTLGESMPSTGVVVEGGESFKLEKTSDMYNFGDTLDELYPKLDPDEMDFLADGTYDDGSIDVEYEQEIDLPNEALTLFADPDYNEDVASVGFWWTNTDEILKYTLDLDDEVLYSDMVDTSMPLLGGEYYVLAASATQIDILDTSQTSNVDTSGPVTVGDYEVELLYVDGTEVKFTVNGETTDAIVANQEYELQDGSYIVATSFTEAQFQGDVESADFSIGSGKIELIDGQEAELNGVDIDGLHVTLNDGSTNSSYFDSIDLTWKSDRDTFLGEGDSISMPGFDVIQLAFGGLDFPSDSETISIENGETLTINMGNYDLPLMWYNSSAASASQKFGEENYELKLAADSYTYDELGYNDTIVWWNGMSISETNGTTVLSSSALNVSEDDRFLVTLINDDLTDVETGYYEVSLIDIDDSTTWAIELTDLIGDNDLKFENDIDDTDDIGVITVKHVGFDSTNTSAVLNFSTTASGTIAFNKAVSEMGLVATFPNGASAIDDATDGDGYVITFQEEDKDDDLEDGVQFTATVKNTTNNKYHVSEHNVTDYEVSTDNWLGYVVSDLATKITFDDSADENDYTIEYYGAEVTADVQVVAGGEVSSSNGALGDVLVKDSEIDSVKTKNLIVVGGSCINSVAATLVGGAYCGPSWTTATEVGTGQFLIQSYGDAFTNGKIALLVAGYEAADTVNGATYLRTQDVDTTAGNKYVGTSSTSAELVVA